MVIPAEVRAELEQHARNEAPNEACGLIVLRDGRKTTGHVALTRVQYSAGTVTQRGAEVDLDSIAYIKFADPASAKCKSKSRKKTP